ncbi:LacI family transcriptional regulator [Kitasatospora sp. NE20-6]
MSIGAVSLALNGRPGVSAATADRIRAAADDLGWAPNQAAQALAGHRHTDTIGLVLTRPARQLGLEPFYMEFISGIESVLEQHSHALLLRLARDAAQEIEVQRDWWKARRITGSIVVDLRTDDPRVPAMAKLGIPAVAVGHPDLVADRMPTVWTDDATAIQHAVRYLAVLGHRRIARIGGDPDFGHTAIRTRAMENTARELGLPPVRTITTDFSGDEGARATRELLGGPERPTALLYDNDIMAVAGLSAANGMGLHVPRDVSIVAWDDSQLCRLTRPTLSALGHDIFGFGAHAARRLLKIVDRTAVEPGPAQTPVLTPRGSSGPPPPSPRPPS